MPHASLNQIPANAIPLILRVNNKIMENGADNPIAQYPDNADQTLPAPSRYNKGRIEEGKVKPLNHLRRLLPVGPSHQLKEAMQFFWRQCFFPVIIDDGKALQ